MSTPALSNVFSAGTGAQNLVSGQVVGKLDHTTVGLSNQTKDPHIINKPGDIANVNGKFKMCIVGGNPGKWVNFTTYTTSSSSSSSSSSSTSHT